MNVNLKFKIIKHHRTQRNFAELVGVDEATVSREINKPYPVISKETQKEWARVLNCEVDEIFPELE